MPNLTTCLLAPALIAALSLAVAPAARAQTDAGTETETGTDESGPKRLKAPQQDEAAGAPDGAAEASGAGEASQAETVDMLPEDEAEPAAPDAATAEGGAGTEPAAGAASEPADSGGVMVTEEAGTGPFVGDFTIGDPEAPVQVVEYASFTCPHCASFHREAWPELKTDFVDTDRIGFTLREVYFDPQGLWASMAARCGGEAAFYPLADQFLKNQSEWTQAEDIAQAIAGIARRGGLTDAQLKACLENQEFAELLVADYQQSATADEVQSTPTFIIRGPDGTETVVGNRPDEVRQAIENALGAG